jgi:hypothetical protein
MKKRLILRPFQQQGKEVLRVSAAAELACELTVFA